MDQPPQFNSVLLGEEDQLVSLRDAIESHVRVLLDVNAEPPKAAVGPSALFDFLLKVSFGAIEECFRLARLHI